MGRYYSGNISGKFWFALQDSRDADHFGGKSYQEYHYYGCNCSIENDSVDLLDNKSFCTTCYASYKDHFENTIEERKNDKDNKKNKDKLYYESEELYYEFDEADISYVEKVVNSLEKECGKYISKYDIEDSGDNEDITYKVELSEHITNIPNDRLEKVARLCLGKQILHSLNTYGSCGFSTEL